MNNTENIKDSNIIVFGGSGFIGNHVVSELVKSGYNVTIFDKIQPEENFGCKVIVGDILDQNQVLEAIQGNSIVYNFAGWADLESSSSYPVEVIKQNILGSTILLEAAKNCKVERFVYASSIYVFSKFGGFYRASKQACELIIEEYQRRYGLDFTILRFGSLYGPGSKPGNTIYDLITQAVKNKAINYWGIGDELRQFIHVNDAARGSVEILSEEYKNEHIILTGPEDVRIKDLVVMINEIFGNILDINFNPSSRINAHYKITPYSFNPKLGKKLMFRSYTDIGQGLLESIQSMYEEIHSAELDKLGQFNIQEKKIL